MSEERRPTVSFDIDGVLATPFLGRNFTVDREVDLEPFIGWAPAPGGHAPPGVLDRLLMATYYRLRYAGRPLRPSAAAALRAANGAGCRVVALSGRNWRGERATRAWLARHGLAPLIDGLYLNDRSLRSARFKELVVREQHVVLHVDDDAATAALLARCGIQIALIDWPPNRNLRYPPGVERFAGLDDLAEAFPRLLGEETR